MPLINCKIELKLRWTNYCNFFSAAADNNEPNSSNIIFTIKDIMYVPVINLSVKDNQKLSKPLGKEFERSVYWNEHKAKSENKNTTNE